MNDYLIVGGGLLGLFTARALNEAGAQVTVLERGRVGGESSWAGGGILSPLYPWKYPQAINDLATWSQRSYPRIAAQLLESTGIDVEWTQSGLLILDEDETVPGQHWARSHDANLRALAGVEVAGLEPAAARSERGLLLPEIAQIRPPRLIQALKQDLLKRGVRVVENTEITHLLTQRDRIQGVKTDCSEMSADKVIIACGAWTAMLLKDLRQSVDINPVRGQMLLYRGEAGRLQHILLYQGHYVIPRRDGRILVGSTMEQVGFDKAVTDDAREELVAAARKMVPFLADTPLERHWSGLRPGSLDGLPYIGPHPTVEGLYLNAGHFRNGVVMAPASARLLTDILLQRTKILDPNPYTLENRSSAA